MISNLKRIAGHPTGNERISSVDNEALHLLYSWDVDISDLIKPEDVITEKMIQILETDFYELIEKSVDFKKHYENQLEIFGGHLDPSFDKAYMFNQFIVAQVDTGKGETLQTLFDYIEHKLNTGDAITRNTYQYIVLKEFVLNRYTIVVNYLRNHMPETMTRIYTKFEDEWGFNATESN